MPDAEAKKIRLWAENGDRETPEELGLDRSKGWPVHYEQVGTGFEPERTLMNQLTREQTGLADTRMREGIPRWDAEINYRQYAFVVSDTGRLMVSLVPTGPVHGNVTDPDSEGQTVWRQY